MRGVRFIFCPGHIRAAPHQGAGKLTPLLPPKEPATWLVGASACLRPGVVGVARRNNPNLILRPSARWPMAWGQVAWLHAKNELHQGFLMYPKSFKSTPILAILRNIAKLPKGSSANKMIRILEV